MGDGEADPAHVVKAVGRDESDGRGLSQALLGRQPDGEREEEDGGQADPEAAAGRDEQHGRLSLRYSPRVKLSVVIPAYNEAATIREIVSRVVAVPIEKEILVIDDGSTDGTREILKELEGRDGVRVFFQEQNGGKGTAIARGFLEARGDLVLIQDADLEYDPADYPRSDPPDRDRDAPTSFTARGSSAAASTAFSISGTPSATGS